MSTQIGAGIHAQIHQLPLLFRQNSMLIGENCQNLGKPIGSCFRKKTFLAYNEKTGWHLITLNWIQLIFRRIFGCYKSTHLTTVAMAWERYRVGLRLDPDKYEHVPHFDERMHQLWDKTYPKKAYPTFALFLGNTSSLQDADVIGFAESHLDELFCRYLGDFINGHFPDHAKAEILVESLETGTVVPAHQRRVTRYVTPDRPVQGWEPKGIKKVLESAEGDAEWKKLGARLLEHQETIISGIYSKELLVLRKQIDTFLADLPRFCKYIANNAERGTAEAHRISASIASLMERLQINPDDAGRKSFFDSITAIIAALEGDLIKAQYQYPSSPEYFRVLKQTFAPRNESLRAGVDRVIGAGKKALPLTGAAHLLTHRPPRGVKKREMTAAMSSITSMVKKYKVVIITPRDMSPPKAVLRLNPHLREVHIAEGQSKQIG